MRELGTDAVPARVPPARPSASVVPAARPEWQPTLPKRPSVAVSRARVPARACTQARLADSHASSDGQAHGRRVLRWDRSPALVSSC